MSHRYEKLKTLLKELFQLDQPDLDFGLYRIMHAKSAEVSQFLDADLLPQVKQAFELYQTADKAELEKELAKVVAGIEAAGMDPEQSPKVAELREKLEAEAVDLGQLEGEVYDHLFSFFRRYYSEGDFLSKRVYKPGVYAIPYEGEEVKLHWANADQYYIKTSEYLRDYAFRLRPNDQAKPMRVHLRLVDVGEGEHGNVKATEGKDRRFKLDEAEPLVLEDGELVVRFTYQPEAAKQKELNAAAEEALLTTDEPELAEWVQALSAKHVRVDGTASENTRLRVHIDRYTARNTFDYFVHKDLGPFLRRELDFYIKNEVMHLDDIEHESVPRVEQYLSKIKVIRRIAGKVIDFLAQLEDFQKKLWLKKKFVVETSWCIRVGAIPDALYPEIAANEAQHDDWVKLYAIDEFEEGSTTPKYSKPLRPEFLFLHPTLVVDTRHFDAEFNAKLIEEIGDVDGQIDGVLVNGENFQALSIMQSRYREQVKCAFIDPPYNTGKDDFAYKDTYRHSSWLALMDGRLRLAIQLIAQDGLFMSSIDEHEAAHLRAVCALQFGSEGFAADLIWNTQHSQQSGLFAPYHEYVQVYTRIPASGLENFRGGDGEIVAGAMKKPSRANPPSEFVFPPGTPWDAADGTELLGTWGGVETVELTSGRMLCEDAKLKYQVTLKAGWTQKRQMERFFSGQRPVVDSKGQEVTGFFFSSTGKLKISKKRSRVTPNTILPSFGTVSSATESLSQMFGREAFGRPKPVAMMEYLVGLPTRGGGRQMVLDFFAGSGTTGHAVISLNRTDDSSHCGVLLIEAGDHFDTVLLPRLKKVTFTPEWKDGKPKRLATAEEAERSPRIMKVVRLESYEDTLNNLEVRRSEAQGRLLLDPEAEGEDGLKEQYVLRYMLDVETRGSQSLLNVDAFTDPTAYKLKVRRPGSDESREVNVDLLETFNWLIGLTVQHMAAPRAFSASFERDDEQRLQLDGRLREDVDGPFWFRTVTGTTPDGRRTLVIWRKLTGTPEEDNLVLDEWFTKQGYSAKDSEFDLIYVNGGNNLENLKTPDDLWKVRLIEEDFHRLMFETEGV